MEQIPNIYVNEYVPSNPNRQTRVNGVVTAFDYVNLVSLLAHNTGRFFRKNEEGFSRDELWVGPEKEGEGRHLFASGLKKLIGLTEEGLSNYNAQELKKVFFSYCDASAIIIREKNFGTLLKYSQYLIALGGGLLALKYFFDSGGDITFDRIVEAGLIFGSMNLLGMWVGDKGRNIIKNASRQKFTPRVSAGMDVYRVEPGYLEDFFREKL